MTYLVLILAGIFIGFFWVKDDGNRFINLLLNGLSATVFLFLYLIISSAIRDGNLVSFDWQSTLIHALSHGFSLSIGVLLGTVFKASNTGTA